MAAIHAGRCGPPSCISLLDRSAAAGAPASHHRRCLFLRRPRTGALLKQTLVTRAAADNGEPVHGAQGESAGSRKEEKQTVVRRRRSDQGALAEAGNLQTVGVQDKGVAVEGVARIERDGLKLSPKLRIAGLAGGDLLALLIFAWIGRATHVSAAIDLELLKTVDPFVGGWVLAAYTMGDYLPEREPPRGVRAAAIGALRTWALGIPLGLAIRGFTKGEVPPAPFVAVSLASTLVLILGWRTAYAALTSKGGGGADSSAGDRKGNPLEFFQLLASLVRRW